MEPAGSYSTGALDVCYDSRTVSEFCFNCNDVHSLAYKGNNTLRTIMVITVVIAALTMIQANDSHLL